ncbi:hypothetical protein X777_06930 [Ooceraea biroi]|uniref:Uncharacterized protein n=1 Tax=Ooceraea biroi TaxID=2015173 RepID=A0A026WD93_OOCBI|nr:hypothetical protein X777_06930 [Ooceraea biroi]
MSLISQGRRDAAAIVKEVTCSSPQRATKIKKRLSSSQEPTKMIENEALVLYVDTKMTKRQYLAIRDNTKDHRVNIYPSYEQLLLAKKNCYPPDITVTEISAEIKLQSLVDHTIKRLMLAQNEVLAQVNCIELKIIFKWGSDGAAGQSRYKQRFASENDDDSFLFSISLVPLRLIAKKTMKKLLYGKIHQLRRQNIVVR